MTAVRRIRLPAALAVAAAIHAGLLVVLTQPEERGLAAALGTGGVTISLGPAGRAPGSVPSDPVALEPEVAPPEPLEPVAGPAVVAEAEVMDLVRAVTMTVTEVSDPAPPAVTRPATDRPAVAEEPRLDFIEPPDSVPPIQAASAPPPAAVEDVVEPPAIEPEPAVERIQPLDLPEPVQGARAPPAAPLPPRRPEALAERSTPAPGAAQPPGQGGVSGSTAESDRGSGDSSSGGGAVGTSEDYDALLLAWLERHKTYPRRARIQQRQGTVLVRFVIDGDGALISSGIARSSGHEILDREGLETIRRAAPMPQPPPELAGTPLERVVPIAFSMR